MGRHVMKQKAYSLLLMLLVALGQCKEAYEFDTFDQPDLLVVSGYVSDQPGPYPLFLGTTIGAKKTYPKPVLDAVAYLTDGDGNSESYESIGNGNYQLLGNKITGQPGGSYRLHITLADGRTYQSTLEVMPTSSKASDVVNVGVIQVKVLGFEDVPIDRWQINVNMTTTFQPPNNGYYRWSVEEVYMLVPTCFPGAFSCPDICYITAPYSPYQLNVVDRSNYSSPTIQGIQLLNHDVDYTFSSRHYFNVTQYGMNASCFGYWQRVKELVLRRGSIFDAPPATIRGNVSNVADPNEIVLGYFEASQVQVTRKFIDRGEIPSPLHVPTCFYYDPDYYLYKPHYCSYCLNIEGAKKEPPSWFW